MRPSMAAVKTIRPLRCKASNAARQFPFSGQHVAEVIATSRPPGSSRASADAMCRSAASFIARSTCAMAEKGGFIRTTVGRWPTGSLSSIDAASCLLTGASMILLSSSARVSLSSLRTRFARISSACTASIPVPADGSSTTSPGSIIAAVAATKASPSGVENC